MSHTLNMGALTTIGRWTPELHEAWVREVDRSGVGLWEWSAATGQCFWSPRMYEIYEVESGTTSIRDVLVQVRIPSYDREGITRGVAAALERGIPILNTHRVKTASGKMRYIRATGAVVTHADGSKSLLGTATDVSDYFARSFEKNQIANYYRTLIGSIPAAVIAIDSQGTVEEVNDWFLTRMGYARDHVVGHNVSKLMPEEYRIQHSVFLRRYLSTGNPHIIGKGRYVPVLDGKGGIHSYFLSVEEYRWEDQLKFLGIMIKIPEIHADKGSTHHPDPATLLRAIRSWILIVDREFRVIDVLNSRHLQALRADANILGCSLDDLISPLFQKKLQPVKRELTNGVPEAELIMEWELGGTSQLHKTRFLRVSDEAFMVFNEDLTAEQLALQEKSVLLREVVHRVKNNFQVLDSLIALHGARLRDPDAIEFCHSLRSRVYNLSLVHDYIYNARDFNRIALHDYLLRIIHNLFASAPTSFPAKILTASCSLQVSAETAARCGAILNELVTNSIKYGFSKSQATLAAFWIEVRDSAVTVRYFDDGPYYTQDLQPSAAAGLGQIIIDSFTESLNGTITTEQVIFSDPGIPDELRGDPDLTLISRVRCQSITFPVKVHP